MRISVMMFHSRALVMFLSSLIAGCGQIGDKAEGTKTATSSKVSSDSSGASTNKSDINRNAGAASLDSYTSSQGHVEETILSTCFLEAPFRSAGVTYQQSSYQNGTTWYDAIYQHGYVERSDVMVTTFDAYGKVVQQITVKRNSPKSVKLKSTSHFPNGHWDQPYPSDTVAAIAEMKKIYDGEVAGRMLMQCTQ